MSVLRRLLALLVALALIATGVFVVVEVVAAWFDRGPVLLSETATQTWRTTRWDDHVVVWTAVVVGIVGLVLIVVGAWPAPSATVPSRVDDVQLERRPLEDALRRSLEAVDGIANAEVSATDGVSAHVETNRATDTETVETASRARLDETTQRLAVAGDATLTMRAPRRST
jgi:multisubunit Na+/H+ antiporter MnhC subunit